MNENDIIIDGNIIINLNGDAITVLNNDVRFKVSNNVFYDDSFSFWWNPLTWLAIKILSYKHRSMRGELDSFVNISSEQTVTEGEE